jgi:hypothetical protein
MDGRHHRVSREIIFVPVEVPAAGSPAPPRQAKPNKYPVQHHQPWQPARAIPSNSKGAATVRLLRQIAENDAAARSMLRPRPPAATVAR